MLNILKSIIRLNAIFAIIFMVISCEKEIKVIDTPDKKDTVVFVKPVPELKPIVGFNQNWSLMAAIDDLVIANIKKLKPQMLRYPGGTITHSWDWQSGNKIGSTVLAHKIDEIKTLSTNTNVGFVFVLDIVNRTLEDQMLMLSSINKLGVSIDYIELGNELYGQDVEYVEAFPTGAAYAQKALIWTKKIKEIYPKAKISALLQCRSSNASNQRLRQWNDLVISGLGDVIDAYTYHIYIADGQSFEARFEEFKVIAGEAKTENKELWITEYGNQGNDAHPNYLKSLDSLADNIERFPKVTIALNHALIAPNKNKLTADGKFFTPEGNLFLARAAKRTTQ